LTSEKLFPLYKDSEVPVLPYETVSLCPECMQNIPATVKEEDGKVVMVKKCPDHGEFKQASTRSASKSEKGKI